MDNSLVVMALVVNSLGIPAIIVFIARMWYTTNRSAEKIEELRTDLDKLRDRQEADRVVMMEKINNTQKTVSDSYATIAESLRDINKVIGDINKTIGHFDRTVAILTEKIK